MKRAILMVAVLLGACSAESGAPSPGETDGGVVVNEEQCGDVADCIGLRCDDEYREMRNAFELLFYSTDPEDHERYGEDLDDARRDWLGCIDSCGGDSEVHDTEKFDENGEGPCDELDPPTTCIAISVARHCYFADEPAGYCSMWEDACY